MGSVSGIRWNISRKHAGSCEGEPVPGESGAQVVGNRRARRSDGSPGDGESFVKCSRPARRIVRAGALSGAGVLAAGIAMVPGSSLVPKGTAAATSSLPPLASPVPAPGPNSVANQSALDISTVINDATIIFGGNYAGAWVDNSGDPAVLHVLAKTSGIDAIDQTLETAFMGLVPSSVRPMIDVSFDKYSESQLEGFESTLVNYAGSHWTNTTNHPQDSVQFFIDTIDDAVGIGLDRKDSSYLPALQALIPSDALRIRWTTGNAVPTQAGPGWRAGVSDCSFPPYRAGLALFDATLSRAGTTGYLLEAGGRYYGMTAGHIVGAFTTNLFGNGTYDGGCSYGIMGKGVGIYSYGTGDDSAVFELVKQGQWTPQILAEWNSTAGFIDNVVGRVPNDQQLIGTGECEAGVTTNAVNCSTEISTSGSTGVLFCGMLCIKLVGNLACGTATTKEGDSSGPVYEPVPGNEGKAMGDNSIDTSVAGVGYSCWSTIDSALQGITNHTGYNAYVVGALGTKY